MKQVLEFLAELQLNNNKAWFDQHKPRYKEVQAQFNVTAEQLINSLGTFDVGVRGVTVKESTYRIYRDIRFSPNKIPYKTHIGLYICAGGKKSGNAGYYFHVEPGNSMLAVGLHCPEPKIVKSVREDIFSLYTEFQETIHTAKAFDIDIASSLKRTPREFPADAPSAEYLRLKEFDLIMPLSDKQVLAPDLVERLTASFRSAKPFNDFLNRAVNFAREDNNDEQGL